MVMVVMVISDLQGDVRCWGSASLVGVTLSVQQRMDVSAHCLTSVCTVGYVCVTVSLYIMCHSLSVQLVYFIAAVWSDNVSDMDPVQTAHPTQHTPPSTLLHFTLITLITLLYCTVRVLLHTVCNCDSKLFVYLTNTVCQM